MKKWVKGLLIGGSVFLGTCLVTTVGIGIGAIVKWSLGLINAIPPPPPLPSNILYKSTVKQNFEKGGIWENKTFLTANDFESYNEISFDAFNNIDINLESIELSGNLIINGFSKNLFGFRWEKVENIKIKSINGWDDNLMIVNNILFAKDIKSDKYLALTIANRNPTTKSEKEIFFPCYQTTKPEYTSVPFKYEIYPNFFNNSIFKNITKIGFYDTTTNGIPDAYYAITRIGKFNNCKKFSPNLTLYNASSCIIGDIINSNIENFNYFVPPDTKSNYIYVRFYGSIHGEKLNSFKFENQTNVTSDVVFFNEYSGFFTTQPNFNFDLILKDGDLRIVNQKVVQEPGTPKINNDSFIHRIGTNQNSDIYKIINFDTLNLKIFLKSQEQIIFEDFNSFLDSLCGIHEKLFEYDQSVKLLEPSINSVQGFNCIVNFNKQILINQITSSYYEVIKQEQLSLINDF